MLFILITIVFIPKGSTRLRELDKYLCILSPLSHNKYKWSNIPELLRCSIWVVKCHQRLLSNIRCVHVPRTFKEAEIKIKIQKWNVWNKIKLKKSNSKYRIQNKDSDCESGIISSLYFSQTTEMTLHCDSEFDLLIIIHFCCGSQCWAKHRECMVNRYTTLLIDNGQ